MDVDNDWCLVRNLVFCCLLKPDCLSGGMSSESNKEVVFATEVLLPMKKKSRVAYKGHLTKLEKDINTFLNDFGPGNLFYPSKAKSFKSNMNEMDKLKI